MFVDDSVAVRFGSTSCIRGRITEPDGQRCYYYRYYTLVFFFIRFTVVDRPEPIFFSFVTRIRRGTRPSADRKRSCGRRVYVCTRRYVLLYRRRRSVTPVGRSRPAAAAAVRQNKDEKP